MRCHPSQTTNRERAVTGSTATFSDERLDPAACAHPERTNENRVDTFRVLAFGSERFLLWCTETLDLGVAAACLLDALSSCSTRATYSRSSSSICFELRNALVAPSSSSSTANTGARVDDGVVARRPWEALPVGTTAAICKFDKAIASAPRGPLGRFGVEPNSDCLVSGRHGA